MAHQRSRTTPPRKPSSCSGRSKARITTHPRRDKILSYQAQQDFPILPYPDDPDCGNLYRNLKFPSEIYDHISNYQEAKLDSHS